MYGLTPAGCFATRLTRSLFPSASPSVPNIQKSLAAPPSGPLPNTVSENNCWPPVDMPLPRPSPNPTRSAAPPAGSARLIPPESTSTPSNHPSAASSNPKSPGLETGIFHDPQTLLPPADTPGSRVHPPRQIHPRPPAAPPASKVSDRSDHPPRSKSSDARNSAPSYPNQSHSTPGLPVGVILIPHF